MKPNKMKGVDRPITNPTGVWRVCFDLCSLGFSWFGLDLMGEKVKGSIYEKELQKATQETFRIEKVLKRDNKKKLA